MKKIFTNPEIEILKLGCGDVVYTSGGTYDETDKITIGNLDELE